MDSDNLRNDATDRSGSVELTLALATLGREVPHEIFISIAEDVIAFGAVLRKVECLVFKDGD